MLKGYHAIRRDAAGFPLTSLSMALTLQAWAHMGHRKKEIRFHCNTYQAQLYLSPGDKYLQGTP